MTMVSDDIARLNSITPYYCPNGNVCGGRCRFAPCPNRLNVPDQFWWKHLGPRDLPSEYPATWVAPKPRYRVKAGSRKVASPTFEQQISEVYADLADGQEPLGAEFEAVWSENVDELYEP